MTKILVWVAAGILIGTSLLWPQKALSQPEAGRVLYNDKCALCHGFGGDGNGPAGSSLSPKPTDFTDPKFWQTTGNQKIMDTILNGTGIMPAFSFKTEEVQALIDYIRTFRK
jgi:mono/diheme cytochrome c family protein